MASDDDNTPEQPPVVQDEPQNEPQETSNTSNPISSALDASNDPKNVLQNASSLSRDEKNNNEKEAEEEDIDDDSALARMMAIQEEEQEEEEENDVAEGQNNEHDEIEFDPNIAIIGNNDDDFQENDFLGVAADNNVNAAAAANNPAAIALRQRQALQNQHRQDQLNALNNQPFLTRQILKFLRPLCRYTPLSILAALLLLHHTLRTRQQFYLAVVYVQSSKLSYIIFGNAIIALAVSTFSLITKLFLDGGLRPNERDAIGENIRWDVTETCLALTIFRSELDVVTAVLFLGLVVVKW
jgi:thiol:disulfide interchange protein